MGAAEYTSTCIDACCGWAVSLRTAKRNFKSRKRLPDAVREEYGRLYGPRFEAKFSAPASTKPHRAKQLFGEWLGESKGELQPSVPSARVRASRLACRAR